MRRAARMRCALAAWLVALLPCQGWAQAAAGDWPNRPIRLVVPFPAGGGSDNVARLIAKGITATTGQPVIVDNKPGAAATIGAQYVAKAAPDGYTLLLGNAAVVTLTPQLRPAGFDPVTSFAPIGTVAGSFSVVAVRKDLPAASIRELAALARREPGRFTCGTSGAGGATHLACAILGDKLGAEFRAVHYKGSAPAVNDLAAGVIDLVIDPAALPLVKNGRVRALAARGRDDGTHPELPGVPGLAEVGAAMGTETWFGVLAPASTPPEIVNRLAQSLERLTQAPDFAATLLPLSLYPLYMGPRALAERIPKDVAQYRDIIRRTGIQAE